MKYFKCRKCGKIVEVLNQEKIPTICCGEEMIELTANTQDAATEKHVPYVKLKDGVLNVKIGEVEHPSTEEHYIVFITVVMGDKVLRHNLKPTETPKASFLVGDYKGRVEVYEYCNLHGLWVKELNI